MQYLRSFETARVVFLDQVGINEERWGKLLFFIETPKSLQDFDFAVGILAQLVVHQKARFNFRTVDGDRAWPKVARQPTCSSFTS